jgi:penicillin-insensitive murein endopeptidase
MTAKLRAAQAALWVLAAIGSLPAVSAAETIADKDAKKVFGSMQTAAGDRVLSIGGYSLGCIAGAKQLPADGPAWQAMRPSRNRAWGHPRLVAYLEKLAGDLKQKDGLPGLLIGDMSQPLGGPMLGGHASHQIGLDADIWFKPMPSRTLTAAERDSLSADNMVDEEALKVLPGVFGDAQIKTLKRAASYPEVARIFVHPAIKKAICDAAGQDRTWLRVIRPWWQHNYHFHVRLSCPADEKECVNQTPAAADDGCGQELDDWFKKMREAKTKPKLPAPPPKPFLVSALPKACQDLAAAASTGK